MRVLTRYRWAWLIGLNLGMLLIVLMSWRAAAHGVCHGYTRLGCAQVRSQVSHVTVGILLVVWAVADVATAAYLLVRKT